MNQVITPKTEADAIAFVSDARVQKAPIRIEGQGTKNGIGRPQQDAITLSSRAMSG